MKNLIILSLFISISSCNKKNSDTGKELITKDIQDSISISGVVKSIEYGKDGYSAKLETIDNLVYFVTISSTNLNNPKQYIESKIGDTLKISGEFWKMGEDNQITVHKIN